MKIVSVITAAYPSHYKNTTTEDITNLVNAWGLVMSDYPYEQVSAGLKIYLASDTKGFPPSPGQVIDCILKVTRPESEYLTEDAAWGLVYRAIIEAGYDPEPVFAKLPKIIQKILGEPGALSRMGFDDNFNEGVEKSHFVRQYRSMIERERNEAKIPESVKEQIRISIERTKQKIEEKEEV